jgi:hypothetical protein
MMSCPTALTVLEQKIDVKLAQTQAAAQNNSSFQGVAVAVAIGNNSEAMASQEAEQCNKNLQVGNTAAINFAANLCGKCINKSRTPDSDLNQEHSETQENDYIQIGSVAISIDGGRACAEQILSQSYSNAQIASLLEKNINHCENKRKSQEDPKPYRKVHKSNDSKNHKTKAVALPSRREKAIVVIDMGSYKLELIVACDGDVYLNNKKIKSGKRYQ